MQKTQIFQFEAVQNQIGVDFCQTHLVDAQVERLDEIKDEIVGQWADTFDVWIRVFQSALAQ